MSRARLLVPLCLLLCLPLAAQDSKVGIAMPMTLSADAMATQRRETFDPTASNWAGSFRATFYPTLRLGSHWFAYSAIQVNLDPLFYYETYYPGRNVDTSLIQAFVGYSQTSEKKAFSIKVGKLASAFGSFPLRYDDAVNPLLDVPLDYYGTYVAIRPDQLPCGIGDFRPQISYRFVRFSCGGAATSRDGIWPVTMYGLPGAEFDFSVQQVDARFQLTNSSPSNSQTLVSDSQNIQWTAGAGYTIREGFRVGFSAYRGPFLEHSVTSFLPAGKGVRDYPATAEGIDVKWARGRLSANGEWGWFRFNYPNLRVSPLVSSGYVEAITILTPRLYAAVRASYLGSNHVEDNQTRSASTFQPNQQSYEFAVGFNVNHFQSVKLGYEWLKTAGTSGSGGNVFGLQFVTSIDSLSKVVK